MNTTAWAQKLLAAYRRATPQARLWWWLGGGAVALLAIYLMATGGAEAGEPSLTALGVSVLFKLVFIVALIYVSLALFRRWQGARLLTRQHQIAVVETVRLSPRQAIHLVRAGEQMLLIGATDAGLNLLADLELSPLAAPQPATATAQPETSFAALLTAQIPAGPTA